jgi:outer membrane protein
MKKIFICVIFVFAMFESSFTQKVAFISSETIRTKFPEAQQAEQRIQSIVDGWKRDNDATQKKIDAIEFEIKKNRLIWTDQERIEKDLELEKLKKNKIDFNTLKYEPGGDYDKTVQSIMQPVEAKIYATVQETASEEGFDIILDQSSQPMPYVNFKYDLTIKVLKKLGVDVEQLEKDLKDKIDKDPRNKDKESKTAPRKSTRVEQPKDKKPSEQVIEPIKKD